MKILFLFLVLNACVFKQEFKAKSEKAYGPKPVSFHWDGSEPSSALNFKVELAEAQSLCFDTSACLLQLERRFWAYIGAADLGGIKSWIDKVEPRVDEIRNDYHRSRVQMLLAFAYIQWSRRTGVLQASLDLLKAQIIVNRATEHLTHSHNAQSLSSFIYLFEALSMSYVSAAEEKIKYMNSLGTEGPDTAAFALLYTSDEKMVERGIKILEGCPEICFKTTTLAPYKELVNMLALMEAYAFLLSRGHRSDHDEIRGKLEAVFADFKRLAVLREWPYVKDLDSIEDALLNRKSKYNFELKSNSSIGLVRLPLGQSQGHKACAYCHVGADIPDYYYD